MRKAETIVAVCLLSLATLVFIVSRDYPRFKFEMGGDVAFYPRLLAGMLAVVSLYLLIRNIVRMRHGISTTLFELPKGRKGLSLLITVGILLVTPYLMAVFGFLITTPVWLFGLLLWLRNKKITIRGVAEMAALSLGITALVYVLFQWGAEVPLPIGMIFRG